MGESFNPFSLIGKTILITGASSGIGRGIAITCSKMGATIVVSGRNSSKLDETLSMMEKGNHLRMICDLTQSGQLQTSVADLPKLDGVVHCAGIGQRLLCKQLRKKDIETVMNINFDAPVLLQKELLEQKKINKAASIVFIASIASWSPSIGNAVYSASKGAIISYANCLSLELASRQIRVNCISPAMVWTDLVLADGIDEELLKEDEKKYPLKRYGTPEDIANLAVYMLSDASSWMTGSNVKISGGGKLS
ncbi:MAG: SDR family oxidoreductase [Prevotella sp.]|nr:SDR family oxidoreductase [Prevotella sp.]